VLVGLSKRIAGEAECIAITDAAAIDAALKG
jgi:hypothetical protein